MNCVENGSLCEPKDQYLFELVKPRRKQNLDSLNHLFDLFVADKNITTNDKTEVAYIYALYLSLLGENSTAAAYFNHVSNSEDADKYLRKLAKIKLAAINSSVNEVNEIQQLLDSILNDNRLSNSRKAIAIDVCLRAIPRDSAINFSLKHISFTDSVPNVVVRYVSLISLMEPLYIATGWQGYDEIIKSLYAQLPGDYLYYDHADFLSSIKIKKREYRSSLEVIEQALYKYYETDNLRYGVYPRLEDVATYGSEFRLLHAYTKARLFQTQLGVGIATVDTAFTIMQALQKARIAKRLDKLEGLRVLNASSEESPYLNNILIGVYLYNRTGEIRYLNESLSSTDIYIGAGLYHILMANNLLKDNEALFSRFQKFRQASFLDYNVDEAKSLVQLHAQVTAQRTVEKDYETTFRFLQDSIKSNYPVALEEIQRTAKKDSSGTIVFLIAKKILYRIVVTGDTIIARNMIRYANEVAQLASVMNEEKWIYNHNTKSDTIARELYQILFSDIDSLLPPSINIVANGSLETLPYNLLRKDNGKGTPRYLGIEHAVSRQFSLKTMELLNELTPEPEYQQPLAFAPSFDADDTQVIALATNRSKLSPLTYNGKEVDWLAELSGGSFYKGEKAVLSEYHKYAKEYSIIHLATHAISNDRDGLESSVYFVNENNQPIALEAGEISQNKLEADLVVLSACETSRGGQNIVEGTIGLTRAYLAAGARSVVASSWAVDDYATAEIMKYFYEHLADGQAPHVAVQSARIDYLKEYPNAHPSKWAAFESFGATQPVRWDRSKPWYGSSLTLTFGAIGAAVFTLLALLLYRRRPAHA